MNVTIIVFSPTGNTRKVGQMLEESLRGGGTSVQLLDITRRHDLFAEGGFTEFLREEVEPHDVLCVGGPVYAHHMQHTVLDLVKALDPPRRRREAYAVPFATYGTVSSGVALAETARLLHRSGRLPALAMKIDARHCYSEILGTEINPGMPGDEAWPHVRELARRIAQLPHDRRVTNLARSPDLDYLGWPDRMKARFLIREKLFQKLIYPRLEFRPEACSGCGLCVDVCPLGRLCVYDGKVGIRAGQPACIHCGICVTTCPREAIVFPGDLSKWASLLRQAASGKGFIASDEAAKSAVYPIRDRRRTGAIPSA